MTTQPGHWALTQSSAKTDVSTTIIGAVPPIPTNRGDGAHPFDTVQQKLQQVENILQNYPNPLDPNGNSTCADFFSTSKSINQIKSNTTFTDDEIKSKYGSSLTDTQLSEYRIMLVGDRMFILGVKGGIADALLAIFGDYLRPRFLRSDGCAKTVDDYLIPEIISTIRTTAVRASYDVKLQAKLTTLQMTPAWRDTFTSFMDKVVETGTRIERSFGVHFSPSDYALVFLSQAEKASKHSWGSAFAKALQTINAKFPNEHVHSNTSLPYVSKLLTEADIMRDRSLAPSSGESAFSASHTSDVLVSNITNSAMSSVYQSAFGVSDDWPPLYANAASNRSRASSTSSSSGASSNKSDNKSDTRRELDILRKEIETLKKKGDKQKSCASTSNNSKSKESSTTCKHCAKVGRKNACPGPKKCFFNPDVTNRPNWAWKQMYGKKDVSDC